MSETNVDITENMTFSSQNNHVTIDTFQEGLIRNNFLAYQIIERISLIICQYLVYTGKLSDVTFPSDKTCQAIFMTLPISSSTVTIVSFFSTC